MWLRPCGAFTLPPLPPGAPTAPPLIGAGIEEKKEEEEEVAVQTPTARPEISVSPEVVAALAKAEAERSAAAAGSSPESTRAVQQQIVSGRAALRRAHCTPAWAGRWSAWSAQLSS